MTRPTASLLPYATVVTLAIAGLAALPGPLHADDAGVGARAGEQAAREQATGTKAADAKASGPMALDLEQLPPPQDEVALGEPVTVTLTVEHPLDSDVLLPDAYDPPRWEILDEDRLTAPGEVRQVTRLTLSFGIFRPGETTLRPFALTVVDRAGRTGTMTTEPVTVTVRSTLGGEDAPSFTAPRGGVPVWVDDYTLAWAGGLAGSALLAGLLVFAAMRRRELALELEPPRPAHEVALEKLGALAADDLVERGEFMIFYVRLSEAVREYLGRRYGFHGTELTTTEILGHLREVTWPPGLSMDDVRAWLEHGDLVKFSGMRPSVDQANDALRRAFTIVELTKPPPKPEEEQEEDGEEVQR